MELLILLGLAGVLAWLWNRVDILERQTAYLRNALDDLQDARWQADADKREASAQAPERQVSEKPQPAPAPPPEEPRPQPTPPAVPAVARKAAAEPVTSTPAPPPQQDDEPAPARRGWRPSFDFEDIFGRLLPIWAGGITLAIAGFFLVSWSIENGLLNEYVRVALGFTFGTLLVAAAELAHRFEQRLADPRVRQALAGAGLATLYASFYLAGSHYGLIGGGVAFAGLAGVTGLAILLSFRFGLPSAVLGLLGGFAAPALAGANDPNLPLLATYLALVTGGLVYTGQKQERSWLGLAALGGGLGWGALMLFTGPHDEAGVLSLGGYLVLIGTMLPALMGEGVLGRVGRVAACAIATLQIAVMVDQSGYSLLSWGVYGLLGAAIAVLGWQNQRLREAGAMSAGLSAFLIASWPDPASNWLAIVSASMAAIFIAPPLAHVLRDKASAVDWAQLALYPVALLAALCVQLWVPLIGKPHMALAAAAVALAIAPAIALRKAWPAATGSGFNLPATGLLASVSALLGASGLLATPDWAAPLVIAALFAAVFVLLIRRNCETARSLPGVIAMAGVVVLAATADFAEYARLIGEEGASLANALRWLAVSLPFAAIAWKEANGHSARAAQLFAVPFAYGALAQLVPGDCIPAVVALSALVLAVHMRWTTAHGFTLVIGFLWALPPLGFWLVGGAAALAGDPMFAPQPDLIEMAAQQLPPLIVAWIGSLMLTPRFFANRRTVGWSIGGALALVFGHMLYKQLFGITDIEQFALLGLAERTVWQALFAAPAIALLVSAQKWAWQRAAGIGMATIALAHFSTFTLLLHNPLWSEQAVGGMPLANLLLPAYGLAIAALIALPGQLTGFRQQLRPVFDGVVMVLLGLLALSTLRHGFSGSMLTEVAMSQQEDLLRSIGAIALALAFLGWGAWKKQRSWRIGSLVLMLLAVCKVFLFDAAGLEGLARIASFLALGLCLIGIGWFYTRQLKADVHGEALPGERDA